MSRDDIKTPIPPSSYSDELEKALATLPSVTQKYTEVARAAEQEERTVRASVRRDRIRLRQSSSTFPRPKNDAEALKMPKEWTDDEVTQQIKTGGE